MRRFGALLLLAALATPAAAEFPDKPIRLIVPQAPGSATDTVARILGAELSKELGQQIVVDNRPGGALTIGLDLTAKARTLPDLACGAIELRLSNMKCTRPAIMSLIAAAPPR